MHALDEPERPQRRILYISDLHLASAARYADGTAWFRPQQHRGKVEAFLTRLRQDPPDELVLLGDIFDNWLAPMHEVPATWAEMARDNAWFVEPIAALAAMGVEVTFTPGNHDLTLQAASLPEAWGQVHWRPNHTAPGDIWAEHGHERTFFNTTRLDPLGELPIGYFFARLGEDRLPGGHSVRAVMEYIRGGALNGLHRSDFVRVVLRVIFGIAGVGPTDIFALSEDHVVTVGEVIERYAMSAAEMGMGERVWRLLQRPTNLIGSAGQLWRRGARAVIMGHSHTARLLHAKGLTYANPGAWCQPICHAIEAHITPDKPPTFRLLRVHEHGAIKQVGLA